MKKWKTNKVETILETPHFKVQKEAVEDFNDKSHDYYRIISNGAVMVVPIKMNHKAGQTKFIMVDQYRHALGTNQIEFPAGKRDRGEPSMDAAVRELKEETGYTPKWIKFLYTIFPDASKSGDPLAIFLAEVEGEPGDAKIEDFEAGAGLKVREFSADQLHKMVLTNECTNSSSMAALLAIMLQSPDAIKYLNLPPKE